MPSRRALGSCHQSGSRSYRVLGRIAFSVVSHSRSYRVLGRAITACAIKACAAKASSGSCYQDECKFLKHVKGGSTSLRVQILFMPVEGRQSSHDSRELVNLGLLVPHWQVSPTVTPSKVRSRFAQCPAGRPGLGFASYSTGRPGLGSLRALQVGLVSRPVSRSDG